MPAVRIVPPFDVVEERLGQRIVVGVPDAALRLIFVEIATPGSRTRRSSLSPIVYLRQLRRGRAGDLVGASVQDVLVRDQMAA